MLENIHEFFHSRFDNTLCFVMLGNRILIDFVHTNAMDVSAQLVYVDLGLSTPSPSPPPSPLLLTIRSNPSGCQSAGGWKPRIPASFNSVQHSQRLIPATDCSPPPHPPQSTTSASCHSAIFHARYIYIFLFVSILNVSVRIRPPKRINYFQMVHPIKKKWQQSIETVNQIKKKK